MAVGKTIPKTPKNNLQSISGRNGPEGHGYGQKEGRPKMSSPSTPEDIFAFPSHYAFHMHQLCTFCPQARSQ